MLSIGIMVILFTMGTQSFLKKQRAMEFEIVINEVNSMLYEARENSRNFKDNYVYGVLLNQTGSTLFKGSTYSSTWAYLLTTLPSYIELTEISLTGSPNTIVFIKNTGNTNNMGSFKIQSEDGENSVFEVNSQWFINITYNAS